MASSQHERFVELLRSSQATEEEKQGLENRIYDVILENNNNIRRDLYRLEIYLHRLKIEIEKRDIIIAEQKQTIADLIKWSEEEINRQAEMAKRDKIGLLYHEAFKEFVTLFFKSERRVVTYAYGLVDLNGFKHIDDTYGHPLGDLFIDVISQIVHTIYESHHPLGPGDQRHYREKSKFDVACRKGDEFLFLVPEIVDVSDCQGLAERLFKEISLASVPGCPETVTASIGITFVHLPPPAERTRLNEAEERNYEWSDGLMYTAKKHGYEQADPQPSDFIVIKEMAFAELWNEPPVGKRQGRSE